MKSNEKLIEAFGELLYVLAMADGEIQTEELEVIQKRLEGHPWGKDIRWSFDYEVKNQGDIEDLYQKVISYCEMHGPDPEYQFLLDLLYEVAEASAGVNEDEQKVMNDFTQDLIERFKAKIKDINML